MAQDNDNNYQDELDVYQATWVLGRQKGNEAPLGKDQLAALLKSGRISASVLSEAEKQMLGGKVSGNEGKKGQDSGVVGMGEKKAIFMVKGLMALLSRELKEKVGKNTWEEMGSEQKNYMLKAYFQYVYGLGHGAAIELLAGGGN